MTNQNKPAFATVGINHHHFIHQEGLTKLEYFSIHCLQGLLANQFNMKYEDAVETSIVCAKELLRQLENEN